MKLSPHFYGPFQIHEKIGKVPYKLDLPTESKIHPVFHVSCLKVKLGHRHRQVATLPPTDNEGWVRPEPERILGRRMSKKKNRAVSELLVKWKGLGDEETSWVEYATLVQKYPNLVDKVF